MPGDWLGTKTRFHGDRLEEEMYARAVGSAQVKEQTKPEENKYPRFSTGECTHKHLENIQMERNKGFEQEYS